MSVVKRKTKSEVLFIKSSESEENKLNKEISFTKNRFYNEDTRDNILLESYILPKKHQYDFNIDEMFNPDHNQKRVNKDIIRIITSKFHQLFLKYVGEIKQLKLELESLKNERNKRKNHAKSYSNNPPTLIMRKSTIGKLCLADLSNNNIIISGEKDDSDLNEERKSFSLEEVECCNDAEDNIILHLKEDEQECFNQILSDFHVQINELELKEDTLRHEIMIKSEEINKMSYEIDDLKQNHLLISQDILNKKKIDMKSRPNSIIINMDNINKDYKRDDANLQSNFDEYSAKSNRVVKLIEENNFYKEIIIKMKDDSFKLENQISELEVEMENYENFKNFILSKNKDLEKKLKEFQTILDSMNIKFNKIDIEFNENC